ncbi:MAG: 3-methyl-2-oxobutanoate hydroxymethyltransferase [Alphaproteobacteria bacterium]|nr:3-methyl-2-oxobutanoate hydroxymethyltransferase [Alphaproteobacteria bacterium]
MINIFDFQKKKASGEKITMVTCYDYTSAALVDKTGIDCILVGDSLAMTMHGFDTTVNATPDMMALHTAAVSRGARDKFIVGDLPFMSYRRSLSDNMDAVYKIMQAGAHSVKLEGAAGNAGFIQHLVESGVPVMGHIGLTPQFVHQLGGYHVQGKTDESAKRLMEEARALQRAGCFALVLECVPTPLAAEITRELKIATIGIGAGPDTDGQVLVFQDLLGLNTDFRPKFVKNFLNGAELVTGALEEYNQAVKKRTFPDAEHSFGAKKLAKSA